LAPKQPVGSQFPVPMGGVKGFFKSFQFYANCRIANKRFKTAACASESGFTRLGSGFAADLCARKALFFYSNSDT
jgi:hypothetical protein